MMETVKCDKSVILDSMVCGKGVGSNSICCAFNVM